MLIRTTANDLSAYTDRVRNRRQRVMGKPDRLLLNWFGHSLYVCWEELTTALKDVHSATPALPLGTLFLIIWRTVLFLCLSSETSLNIFFSHRTSTSSAFEVITETRYINYLLTYLHLLQPGLCPWWAWLESVDQRVQTNVVRCRPLLSAPGIMLPKPGNRSISVVASLLAHVA